jgi:hypothetical protein
MAVTNRISSNWATNPANIVRRQVVGLAGRLAALGGVASGLTCMMTAQTILVSGLNTRHVFTELPAHALRPTRSKRS